MKPEMKSLLEAIHTSLNLLAPAKGLAEVTRWSVGGVSLTLFANTYDDAVEMMRHLGIHSWNKSPYPDGSSTLTGVQEEGHPSVTIRANSLPPTCRIERYVERIPKTQVISSDSEFTEVERTRVVCGDDDKITADITNENL